MPQKYSRAVNVFKEMGFFGFLSKELKGASTRALTNFS